MPPAKREEKKHVQKVFPDTHYTKLVLKFSISPIMFRNKILGVNQ